MINSSSNSRCLNLEEFEKAFDRNLRACTWEPHPQYSVFTQYDQEYYLEKRAAFLHKYRCLYAISKTIDPKILIELGTSAGSSADAFLSAAPDASYVGLDSFGVDLHQIRRTIWDPYEIAMKLFAARGFNEYELVRVDLRSLKRLSRKGDFVVVDAAHDFENEYADLHLALTADPKYVFVDDAEGTDGVKLALERFLTTDISDRVEFAAPIDYEGGGLLIKLRG